MSDGLEAAGTWTTSKQTAVGGAPGARLGDSGSVGFPQFPSDWYHKNLRRDRRRHGHAINTLRFSSQMWAWAHPSLSAGPTS